MARPTKVNIDKLLEYINDGKSVKWIANEFGCTPNAVYYQIDNNDEVRKAFDESRKVMTKTVEHSTFECATGFYVTVNKTHKLKHVEYENGKKVREWEELVTSPEQIYIKPDTTAQIFLLKNWANYSNEPATIELRKEELELHKRKIESEVW